MAKNWIGQKYSLGTANLDRRGFYEISIDFLFIFENCLDFIHRRRNGSFCYGSVLSRSCIRN